MLDHALKLLGYTHNKDLHPICGVYVPSYASCRAPYRLKVDALYSMTCAIITADAVPAVRLVY